MILLVAAAMVCWWLWWLLLEQVAKGGCNCVNVVEIIVGEGGKMWM